MTDLTTTQQSELIAQLMQQIAEMKRTQEPTNLAITANLPRLDHERPPIHFSSPDSSDQPVPISTNPPVVPIQASPIINLTTLDAGPSHVFSQNAHNVQGGSTSHIAHTIQPKIQAPNKYNLLSTQRMTKVPLNTLIFHNPYTPQSTHLEVNLYQEKEKGWKAKEEMAKLNIKEEITRAIK